MNFRLHVEKEGIRRSLFLSELQTLTQALYIPSLEFIDPSTKEELIRRGERLRKRGEMTLEQIWLGNYYKKELESFHIPPLELRWIDPTLGWGVFAAKDFKKREFVAEYSGLVRKRKKEDNKNSYCFEYVSAEGHPTPYIIDARDQGGVSRYINHSSSPNLTPALATLDHITHIVLFAKESIAKGSQLTYDYGPGYWAHRTPPLINSASF